MYKVMEDFTDGLTKEKHKAGDIINVEPGRVIAMGKFIKPVKEKIETEMIDSEVTEKAILSRPKNKGRKNH